MNCIHIFRFKLVTLILILSGKQLFFSQGYSLCFSVSRLLLFGPKYDLLTDLSDRCIKISYHNNFLKFQLWRIKLWNVYDSRITQLEPRYIDMISHIKLVSVFVDALNGQILQYKLCLSGTDSCRLLPFFRILWHFTPNFLTLVESLLLLFSNFHRILQASPWYSSNK